MSSRSSSSVSSSSASTTGGMRQQHNFSVSSRGSKARTVSYKKLPKEPSLALKFMGYAAGKPRKANHIRKYTEDIDEDDEEDEYGGSIVSAFTGGRKKTELFWVTRRHEPILPQQPPLIFNGRGQPIYPGMPPPGMRGGPIPWNAQPAHVPVGGPVPPGVVPMRPAYANMNARPPVQAAHMPPPAGGPVPIFVGGHGPVPQR